MTAPAAEAPLRVLHVASGDLWGGAEAQVALLAPALAARGLALEVVTFNEARLSRTLRERSVTTCVVPESAGVWGLVRGVRRKLRRGRFQVLHLHGYKEAIVGLLASLGLDLTRVRTLHGVPEQPLGASLWRQRIFDRVERGLARLLGVHVIAVSRALQAAESARWPSLHYVPNCVTLAPALPPTRSGDGGPRLLYVGRLEPVKGPDLLLRAFPRIRAVHPGARLALAGAGSLGATLAAQVADQDLDAQVTLLGERDDVPALLARADVVVLPSRGEGMPTLLLEALGAGRPVVATRVGGMPQVTEDGALAELVAPEDPGALADGVCRVLADPEAAAARAERARQHVLQHYGADASAAATVAIYRGPAASDSGAA